MEQKNNSEGKQGKQKSKKEKVSVDTDNKIFEGEKVSGKTTGEHDQEKEHKKTVKNLISAIIILSGIAAGSFFVDIVQFISGSGYSERALGETGVFVANDRTWVAFDDPAIEVQVLTLGEDELAECENCDPTEVLDWLKKFMPTLVAKRVEVSSAEGEVLIDQYNLKTLPAFVFSGEVEESEFYEGEASVLFEETEGKYVLNSTGLGIPVGKYLETPEISDTDAKQGNENAKVKVIVYSDFQCPYCRQFHDQIVSTINNEFKDDVLLVYKDIPLEFHPRAEISAVAARCAQDQEKFWEMSEVLYEKQEEWGNEIGTDEFKRYARTLGLDAQQFNECIDDKKHLDEIQQSMEEAQAFGISGVPATFVNDQFVSGVVDLQELRSMIEEELAK